MELRETFHRCFERPSLPVPVEAIAEDLLGLRLDEGPLGGASGMLIPSLREIWVDAGEAAQSPGRRRFTIAHEIGHWVCQCSGASSGSVFCRDADLGDTDRALEREANAFAATLLMPERSVLQLASAPGAGAAALAPVFGVSELAMAWCLFSLQLGPPPA